MYIFHMICMITLLTNRSISKTMASAGVDFNVRVTTRRTQCVGAGMNCGRVGLMG